MPTERRRRAVGFLEGWFRPRTVLVLTGLDVTGRRVDCIVTTPASGYFRFSGLRTGTYALVDTDGSVLARVDLTAAAPSRLALRLA